MKYLEHSPLCGGKADDMAHRSRQMVTESKFLCPFFFGKRPHDRQSPAFSFETVASILALILFSIDSYLCFGEVDLPTLTVDPAAYSVVARCFVWSATC